MPAMSLRAWRLVGCAGLVLAGCGDDGQSSGDGGVSMTMTTMTSMTTVTTASTGPAAPTTGDGEASADTGGAASSSTGSSPTDTGEPSGTAGEATSSTGAGENHPPVWESTPMTDIVLEDIYETLFEPGQIFLSSSRTDEIRVYDSNSLMFIEAWTHPEFSKVASDLYTYGPNGAAFNERGNLVVAAYETFVEFSDYGVEYAVYPKESAEATENLIFDRLGNLYTTTSTGGSERLQQYAAADYAFLQTIPLPDGAGQLTGITFDGYGRLYLASQTDNTIHVSGPPDADFSVFTWTETLSGAGNPGNFEGLQFNKTGELIAAAGDLVRYDVFNNSKLGTFDDPGDAFPVPLRVDNEGNIYTADYENGSGTAPADIFKFAPDGQFLTKANDPGLFGPFGLALSGTVLAGDPPVLWSYVLAASDPDGDELTYALVSGPMDMVLEVDTDTLRWYVTSEDIGDHEVVLSVDDGHGAVVEQMFTLSVTGA